MQQLQHAREGAARYFPHNYNARGDLMDNYNARGSAFLTQRQRARGRLFFLNYYARETSPVFFAQLQRARAGHSIGRAIGSLS